MSVRYVVIVSLIWSAAVLLGCSGNDAGSDQNANDNGNEPDLGTGSISGVIGVLARENRSSLAEQEPNDALDQIASPVTVEAGMRLEIFGDLSIAGGDLSDSFLFQSSSGTALQVQAILSFDFNPQDPAENDLALGVSDLITSDCTFEIDGQFFRECVNTANNPEVSTFDVEGDFGLTIQILSGEASYVLGLEFFQSEPGSSALTRGSRGVAEEKRSALFARHLPGSGFVPSEVLVKFERSVSEADCRTLLTARGLAVMQTSPSGVYRCKLTNARPARLARAVDTVRTIEAIRSAPGVRVVEPNYRYYPAREPSDEFFGLQWHYALINLPDAWDVTVGSEEVVIAVVDTGILGDHQDIAGRLIAGYDFISDPSSARDGDGIDDDPTDAGDLSGGPGKSSYHGTHVTGTLGATTDNGLDIAGVTWGCRIMPVRALGVGGGTSFDIGEAVRYAAGIANVSGLLPATPAHVINMSIATPAGTPPSVLMGNAITEAVAKGVVVVAAAGTDASSLPAYPAGFDDTIAVAACDPQLALAPYSNFGSTIDLTAPGGNLSTDLTADGFGDGVLSLMGIDTDVGVEFTLSFQHGTSMAAPHLSGVAALMRSVNSALTVDEFREILADTAIDVGPAGPDSVFGAGVVNAAGAVNEAILRAGQVAPTEPKLSLSTHALDFDNTLDQLSVQVTNTGGGVLEVTGVFVEEFVAEGWLGVATEANSGSSNVSGVVATVDRSGLANGSYIGRITVSAQGLDDDVITVEMRVGESVPIDEILFVVAVDAVTRLTVAQDVTSAERGFAYSIENLPPNTYKIYAGTDRDLDDQICDLGELCGGFPSAIVANEIILKAATNQANIDFPLGDIIFEPQAAQKVRAQAVRLLD